MIFCKLYLHIFFTTVSLTICSASFSQNWLGRTKESIRSDFKRYERREGFSYVFTDTDSTLTIFIPDSIYSETKVFYFNNEGKADSETTSESCDECYRKYVQSFLDQKKYGWVKVNDRFYVSKFTRNTVFQLFPEKFSCTANQLSWNKQQYNQLLGINEKKRKTWQEELREIESQAKD